LAVVLAVAALAQEPAAVDKEEPAVVTLLTEKPVVAAVPYKYETEYELDPFEPDKLRRTKTVVTHVVVVRSDGTTSVKSVP